jgi:glycosyltransferase involved in cell wall biosynthesis
MISTTKYQSTLTSLTLGVAVYQSAPYLPELFSSILRLGVGPGRFIFFDDNSTDASAELIKTFIKKNGSLSIDYVRADNNLGIAGAYNRIAGLAKSEWVQILDADDYFLNDFYALVAPFCAPGVAAIATSFTSNVGMVSAISRMLSLFAPRYVPQWFPILGTVSTRSAVIYNTDIVQHIPFIDPQFDGSDILHLINIRKRGPILFLRSPRIFYRIRHSSISAHASCREYEKVLSTRADIPWTFTLDVHVRKKAVALIRKHFVSPRGMKSF